MSDVLRRCRNAVMHVPPKNTLLDKRIEELVAVEAVPAGARHAAGKRAEGIEGPAGDVVAG
jgi:hypothetical protein